MSNWNKESIQALLLNNDKAVERALVILHKRQTDEERVAKETREHNGVGFTAFDAEFYTSLAERVQQGQRLTANMLSALRRPAKSGAPSGICKYWKQLLSAITAREQVSI